MEFVQSFICVLLLVQVVFIHALNEDLDVGLNATIYNQTVTAYNFGVLVGIINPEKYSLGSFEQDQHLLKHSFKEFVLRAETEPITYQDWLVMNNYGLFVDTQESIFEKKTSARSKKRSKKRFLRTVNTGDILISSKSHSGLVGHAAIMITDYWVLEMAGGRRWKKGIRDNNRQISKGDWYDEYCSGTTTVYRCPDDDKAAQAAYWADRNYYNYHGGPDKNICVTYKITTDFKSIDPSYSSKLVLQAYYYGTRGVIRDVSKQGPVIVLVYQRISCHLILWIELENFSLYVNMDFVL